MAAFLIIIATAHQAVPVTAADPLPSSGTIAYSTLRNGNWDIFALNLTTGHEWRITADLAEDRHPSWSLDAEQIAFESHRNHNWDIYVVNSDGSGLTRLTRDPAYDGRPTWSPDGRLIAFESYRTGKLALFVMDADGSDQRLLFSDKDSLGDYGPAWSPDGRLIAFTSLIGTQKVLRLIGADGTGMRTLTIGSVNEESPAWSPDGKFFAFVSTEMVGTPAVQNRRLAVLDLASGERRYLTDIGHIDSPSWSADGQFIAFVSPWNDNEPIFVASTNGRSVARLTESNDTSYAAPVWAWAAVTSAEGLSDRPSAKALYREDVTPANPGTGHPYNFKVLPGVKAIIPKLSDRVDDSFNALRTRLQAELGYDALGNLADATRPASYYSGTSEYLSWHKAGRAFDASFDYATLVREDSGGQTYWRVYLHCASQDGTQGEPLHDFSTSMPHVSSTGETLREGGQLRPLPRGYFVDFTVLAQEYGWDRIAAHAGPNFDWHKSWKAVEYWHFQKTAGLVWYQAMQEVYAPEVMQLYDWYRLLTVNEPVPQMIMHGTPVPLSVRKDFKPHLP